MMVHSPISLPSDPDDILGDPAILMLPVTGLITFPDTLRPSLRIPSGASVSPVQPVPGVGVPLPPLTASSFVINTLPYFAEGVNVVELYRADYQYQLRIGSGRGEWPAPTTVASISADRRVGLFALPLISDQSGLTQFEGADGSEDAPRQAVKLMLESLGFPR